MDDWSIRLRRAVAQQMQSLQAAGVGQLGVPPEKLDPVAPAEVPVAPAEVPPQQAEVPPQQAEVQVAAAAAATTADPATTSAPSPGWTEAQATTLLRELSEEVAACQRCEELACTRRQTVFGVGTPTPRLCFFGEAPGFDEDQAGEPFVGAAGSLLTDIIQKGMKLRRADVYILNVLKCRPPGNRNPEPEEIANCRPFFQRQLEILRPQFICCLGAFAAKTLLECDLSVGRLRGKLHTYRGENFSAQVVVTYHPAYLLRNLEEKKKTWSDIQMLMRAMEIA
ncbi:MAG: uracil-DNA glycosylase [Planctomycetales bacterium]|nr:uracil-DNA glycosylase [Planctomycetales bacterium]